MTVRPATHADLQGILDIYNDAVLTTTATYDYEPRTLEHRLTWFEDHAKQDYAVFVAEDGGRIVGWSALNPYHARVGYRFTTENSVYVAADQRGKRNRQVTPRTAHQCRAQARPARHHCSD
jgi:phosphinothricin acetyltransferase